MTSTVRTWKSGWLKWGCFSTACSILLALFAWPTLVRGVTDDGQVCIDAARKAAQRHDVPADVMLAITLVETGHGSAGGLRPWPWAIHTRGQGHWLDSRAAAARLVRSVLAEGQQNIDIGCFQINYRWHHQNFTNLDAMLDPQTNADYAARLLQGHHERLGSWIDAAGAYHSQTPELAQRYIARFVALRGAKIPGPDEKATQQPRPVSTGHYALLQPGDGVTMGSLVPSTVLMTGKPLIDLASGVETP